MTMEFTTIQLREQLDGDRNNLLADLLGAHQGVFHINGGGTFKLEYVTEGKLTRLAVTRQHADGASWLQKVKCLAIDLWGDNGQRKLQQAFRNVHGIANQIARDLQHDRDTVIGRICPDGAIGTMLDSVGLCPPDAETLAWSAKRAPYSPIALDRLDPHHTRLDDDRLVLAFRHHNDTIELVFTGHPGEQGARALARLHALATGTGPCAERFGKYADLRQLLGQFVRASIEDEAPAELARIVRARVLREVPLVLHVESRDRLCHPPGYLYAPILASDSAIADETGAAIELALQRLSRDLVLLAASKANRIMQEDGCWPVPARPIVEKYADIAMERAQAAARDQLAGHSREAFRRRVEQQVGATPQECASLQACSQQRGKPGAGPASGHVPRHAAFVGIPEGGVRGMAAMVFQQNVSLLKTLWLNLTHPRAKAHAVAPDAKQVLHAGETRYLRDAASGEVVKRHAVMLRAYPMALHFPIGANVPIARSKLADLAAAKTYLGLPKLYEQLHTTIHDDHMHIAVVPQVRLAVDQAVRDMRNERRETLAGLLAGDSLSAPLAGMLGEDVRRDVVAAVVATRMAFLEARAARDVCATAMVHDVAAKKALAVIEAPSLPMLRAMAHADAAARSAHHASRRADEALSQATAHLGRLCGGVDAQVWAEASGILSDSDHARSTHPHSVLSHAFASLIPQIDQEHERLMADETALRQRLDTMRIGKATLGEFNAWTRAEVEHFWRAGRPAAGLAADPAADPAAGQPANPTQPAEPALTSLPGTRLARAETAQQAAYWWYLASLGGEPVAANGALLADGIESLNLTVLDASGRPRSLGGIDAASIDEDRDCGPPADLVHDRNRYSISTAAARLV